MAAPKSLAEIKQILRQQKPYLAEKYGVTELGVFGSYVRGEQRHDSDIDILIELTDPPRIRMTKHHLQRIAPRPSKGGRRQQPIPPSGGLGGLMTHHELPPAGYGRLSIPSPQPATKRCPLRFPSPDSPNNAV